MTVTYDLYKELELDRSWDGQTIKDRLKQIQKIWIQRQSACNDKEQLLLIDKVLSAIDDGYRYLVKDIKRKQYDEALDKAYKDGIIKDVTEQQLQSLIDQAKAYYRKGNIKLAAKCAQEAIDGKVNAPDAYDILARCHFDMQQYPQAVGTVDDGIKVFPDNMHLHWLGARIATIGTKDYDDAQRRVNILLEMAPDHPLGHSEQIYLHLRKGDEDLAFQEIDSYIQSHPEDEVFKRGTAYDLDSYSNSCYYYDNSDNSTFIADEASYKKCLKLRKKAAEIYKDEYTEKQLENAKYFGQKKFDDWNSESIKTLSIYGAVFLFFFWPLGLAFLLMDAALIYFSFRPYWQINKTYVTGQMGKLESIINKFGTSMASFSYTCFRWLINLILTVFKLLIWMVTGGPFR
jgi:tetratricopeptide (TPR) repeat protein